MTYATRADLAARFSESEIERLLDQDGDGNPDTNRLSAAISDAESYINQSIRRLYSIPLPSAQYPALTAIACDLARENLYDDAAPENVVRRARAARKRLLAIADGTDYLIDDAGVEIGRVDRTAATAPLDQTGFDEVLANY